MPHHSMSHYRHEKSAFAIIKKITETILAAMTLLNGVVLHIKHIFFVFVCVCAHAQP